MSCGREIGVRRSGKEDALESEISSMKKLLGGGEKQSRARCKLGIDRPAFLPLSPSETDCNFYSSAIAASDIRLYISYTLPTPS